MLYYAIIIALLKKILDTMHGLLTTDDSSRITFSKKMKNYPKRIGLQRKG